MKIVRLTESNGQTAYFDNTFNDEISLPPFSEVALSSVSINTDPRLLEIDFQSNTIPWEIAGETREIALASARYDESNYSRLLFDMYANMNDDTDAIASRGEDGTSPETGLQWNISDDPKVTGFGVEGKMSIGYQVANYEGAAAAAFAQTNISETGTGIKATYKRDGGSPGDPDVSLVSKAPLGFGGARAYLNLKTITNAGGGYPQGVIFGLTATDHATAGTQPEPLEGVLEIYTSYAGEHFTVKTDEDNQADNGAVIAAGQMIGFERIGQEGYIVPVVYDAAGERVILNQDGDDVSVFHPQFYSDGEDSFGDLFPYIIILGPAANTVIDEIQFSPDPYNIIKNNTYKIISRTTGTRGLQNAGILVPETKGWIDFSLENSQKIANYLGFSAKQISEISFNSPTSMKADKFAWTADSIFGSGVLGQGFYVELMTGTCEGYDGSTGQRKNILAVMPESDSDDKLLFQPSFPVFLEMNNSHPLVLRNIRARVLQTDGTSLGVTGMNSMTLLFKPGKSE